jgi:hypothetical protein
MKGVEDGADRALPVDMTIPPEQIERESQQLDAVWRGKPGLWGWLTNVDHKTLGKRYLVTAFLMFIAGGIRGGAHARSARAA